MDELFTVNLTRGAYVVKREDADSILNAIEKSDPHVLVSADLLGDGLFNNQVRIVTAHVIAIVKNERNISESGRPRLAIVE